MYAEISSSHSLIARASNDAASRPPHSCFQMAARRGVMMPESGDAFEHIPLENFELEAARKAVLAHMPVLRPATDSQGRTIILAYLPGDRDGDAPDCARALGCEVLLISMLHFGDPLRQAGRRFGMGNLAARVSRALVENGSLRRASRALDISHLTAASEMRDAMQAAEVHSQAGLVARLAGVWLDEPLNSDRAIGLVMATFGLKQRDAAIACLRASGLSRPEAAQALGVSQWAMAESSSNVFRTLGVTKAPELSRIVADVLLSADLANRYRG